MDLDSWVRIAGTVMALTREIGSLSDWVGWKIKEKRACHAKKTRQR